MQIIHIRMGEISMELEKESSKVLLELKCPYCKNDIDYSDVKSVVGSYRAFLDTFENHLFICPSRKMQQTINSYN